MSGVDLVTFLRARLDEDERVARAVPSGFDLFDGTGIIVMPANTGTRSVTLPSSVAAFAVRHDPARVLRDVAAKRRIVDDHAGPADSPYIANYCEAEGWCRNPNDSDLRERMPCHYLRLLAAPFAQHPDYDPAWAVEGTVTT